jgi:hypothetical protein
MKLYRALVATAITTACLVATATPAYADNCSSPEDCSNTAWVIGGGAAAVAAIIAAVTAGGWLRDYPGDNLSDECFKALVALRQRIDPIVEQLAQLAVARKGALWESAIVDANAIVLESVLANAQGRAATEAGRLATAGSIELPADVVDAGLAGASGLAENWLSSAQAASATADDLASAVSKMTSMLALDRAAGRSSLITPDVLKALGNEAKLVQTAAQSGITAATTTGTILGRMGIGASLVSLGSFVYSQHLGGAHHFDDMELLGKWKSDLEIQRAESGRWLSFAGELDGRMAALEATFNARVDAYNQRADECGAAHIVPPPWSELVNRANNAAATRNVPRGDRGAVPQIVFPRGPHPIKERDPADPDCDRGAYDAGVAELNQQLTDRADVVRRYLMWEQRRVDIAASIDALDDAYWKAWTFFEERKTLWRTYGHAGAAATVASFFVAPAAAVVLGAGSIYCNLVGGSATPADARGVEVGQMRRTLEELRRTRGYVGQENIRLFNEITAFDGNIAQRRENLLSDYRGCGQKATPPWPAPPSTPKSESYTQPLTARQRPYWEIMTWH